MAAMLTVGRKARLLRVGRSSLATSVPMGRGGRHWLGRSGGCRPPRCPGPGTPKAGEAPRAAVQYTPAREAGI